MKKDLQNQNRRIIFDLSNKQKHNAMKALKFSTVIFNRDIARFQVVTEPQSRVIDCVVVKTFDTEDDANRLRADLNIELNTLFVRKPEL